MQLGTKGMIMSEKNGQGSGGSGGGRCMGGQGRGMGAGKGRGRGLGGQGRGMGGGMGTGRGRAMGVSAEESPNKPEEAGMDTIKKVAVTSEGPTLDSMVDSRFGRCAGFVVVDLETLSTEYADNGSSQVMAQGAGIQAAENVVNAGAQVVLSGYVGPKAFAALEAAGVGVGQDVDGMTVGEAVEKFKRGEITIVNSSST